MNWTPGQGTIADITINNTPWGDSNDPPSYISHVVSGMNADSYSVTSTTPFSLLTPNQSRASYLVNVATQEGYYAKGGQ
jgi:hypothetical protein